VQKPERSRGVSARTCVNRRDAELIPVDGDLLLQSGQRDTTLELRKTGLQLALNIEPAARGSDRKEKTEAASEPHETPHEPLHAAIVAAHIAASRGSRTTAGEGYREDMLQMNNSDVSTGQPLDWQWDAVLRRDATTDGQFVYGVTSTRIFCRPSCPSRRPGRGNVRFFDSPAAAVAAGFRACKRCRPTSGAATGGDAAIIAATRYLAQHADQSISLARLARHVGLSAFHLQRQFKQALGVSPREYQAAFRAERFRRELRAGRDIATATYEAGYGSPSRVYEFSPTGTGMSPATYRRGGAGATIGFVTIPVPLGWLLVGSTAKGICTVMLGHSQAALESNLRAEFPHADLHRDAQVKPQWVKAIVAGLSGSPRRLNLPLDVLGTAFQWRVWRALQQIRPGETRSYSDVAAEIGQPAAVRAVARACATNPVCLLIPCHRVVSKDGGVGGYRWGVSRKQRLLDGEKKRTKEVKSRPE
jgi:AraC family transcriptional regulator of adaptative response/methylated-DNA-[protein]-cysteine methyltransferase